MHATLPAALAYHAETIPDQVFIRIHKGGSEIGSRTFASAWELAQNWAALFADQGLTPGDPVALALPNTESFVGAYYGCLIAGCIPAPLAPMRRIDEADPYLQTVISRARFIGAKAVVVPDDQSSISRYLLLAGLRVLTAAQLDPGQRQAAIRSSPDDIGLIQFTSGTAGDPKAVLLSQRALLAQCELLQNHLGLQDRFVERGVSWLPLFHDMGLIGFLLTPGYAGGEINLLQPEDFILRPSLWLKALTEVKATVTGGPPSAFALCARRVKEADAGRYDLSSVRVALVGAEQVTCESVGTFCDRFRAAGFHPSALLPTYGLAENGLAVTVPPLGSGPRFDTVEVGPLAEGIARLDPHLETGVGGDDGHAPPGARQFASVGPPLPGMTVWVVDEDGNHLPERRIGEIVVQSPSLMRGYFANGEATRQAIGDGRLHTGDLGYLADGNLHLTGRRKELILVGGRSYYPADVEQALSGVDGVRMDRAVAIGVEDPERATEKLVVLVETDRTEAAGRSELRMNIRRALLSANYPIGEVVLLKPKSIQSTLTGKLRRVDCKTRYLDGEFQAEAAGAV
jgi:fatty-acyl-CoA synthase